jgi:hypothetical protein
LDPSRPERPRKRNPPHVKLYRTTCDACNRVYGGNFPMWVRIGPFPCICGARVRAPLILDDDGEPLAVD